MFNEVFSRRQDVDYGDGAASQWQRVLVDTAGTYGSAIDSDYEEHTEDEDEEELFGTKSDDWLGLLSIPSSYTYTL